MHPRPAGASQLYRPPPAFQPEIPPHPDPLPSPREMARGACAAAGPPAISRGKEREQPGPSPPSGCAARYAGRLTAILPLPGGWPLPTSAGAGHRGSPAEPLFAALPPLPARPPTRCLHRGSDALRVAVDLGPCHYPHLSWPCMSRPSFGPESPRKWPKLTAPRSGSPTVAVGLGPRWRPRNPGASRSDA